LCPTASIKLKIMLNCFSSKVIIPKIEIKFEQSFKAVRKPNIILLTVR
jgi:hypothetical protein